MNIDISIIIPVYNPPHDLFEICIKNLLEQMGQVKFEFIFVNDGSTDSWVQERLERLKQEDSRVIVITQSNGGISVARNVGMEMAKGEYIAFCDSDDAYKKDAFEYMYNVATKWNADVAVFGMWRESEEQEDSKLSIVDMETKRDMLQAILSYRTSLYSGRGLIVDSTWAKLLRREIIEKNKMVFDKTLCVSEDALFLAELYEYSDTIVLDSKRVYKYTVNNLSLTRRYKKEYNDMIPTLIKAEKNLIERHHKGDSTFEDAVAMRTFVALTHADHCYFIPRLKEKDVIKELRGLWNNSLINSYVRRNKFSMLRRNGFRSPNYYIRLLIYKYKMVKVFTIMARSILFIRSVKSKGMAASS